MREQTKIKGLVQCHDHGNSDGNKDSLALYVDNSGEIHHGWCFGSCINKYKTLEDLERMYPSGLSGARIPDKPPEKWSDYPKYPAKNWRNIKYKTMKKVDSRYLDQGKPLWNKTSDGWSQALYQTILPCMRRGKVVGWDILSGTGSYQHIR